MDDIACALGIIGALLNAFNCSYSKYSYPIWILSSIAWVLYAMNTNQQPLLTQQMVFIFINIIGLFRWNVVSKKKDIKL